VAIECFEKNSRKTALLPLQTDTNFHLLLHDSTSFERFGVIPSATFRDVSVVRSGDILQHALSLQQNTPEVGLLLCDVCLVSTYD